MADLSPRNLDGVNTSSVRSRALPLTARELPDAALGLLNLPGERGIR